MSQANEPYERGREIVPGYRLVKLLGRGGFGEVWKATAPGGTEVAVKVIQLGGYEGRKELKALQLVKQVRHPHLVPITAFWIKRADGTVIDDEEIASSNLLTDTHKVPEALKETMLLPAEREELEAAELIIAMGLGRQTLHDRLKEHQKQGRPGIPQDELIEYIKDAAQAIDYLNNPIEDFRSTGIQHCDVKPHNIMLVGGATQVCDFGLAQMLGAKRTTTPMATLAYAAPECLQQGEPSSTTDQYSLAVTYYELRTGKLPYREGTYVEVFNTKLRGDLDFSGVSQPEQAVLRRGAALDPAKRYASCTEMIKAVELAVAPKEEIERKRPSLVRRLLPVGAVCAAIVVGAWALWPAVRSVVDPVKEFRDLLHDRRFAEALEWLETPPRSLTEEKKGELREDARKAWSADILDTPPDGPAQTVRNECSKFLEHFPEDHQIRLRRADVYAILGKWQDALADLNALKTDKRLPPPLADQAAKLGENVRERWLAEMLDNWGEKRPEATRRECDAFLEHFPESPEGRLIRARALVRLSSYDEALKDLETLPEPENLPKELLPLQRALVLITADSRPERDPENLLSVLEELENLKDSAPPEWSLDSKERSQIADAADRLFSDLLRKAGDHIGQEQLAEARTILGLADKPFAPETKRPQIRLWQAVLDPQTEVGQPAWETATQLMRDGTLSEQRALATALGQISHKKLDAQTLERQLHEAIQVVRIGCDNPREKQLRRQLGELWKQRIAVLLTAEAAPTVKEYQESEKDWVLALEAGFSSSLVDAWRAECLLELGLNASLAYELANRALLKADDLPADEKVYLHYVRALGLGASAEILDDLDQVFPDSGPPPPFLSVRNRLARAVDLAVKTAQDHRQQAAKQAPSQLDRVLGVLPADQQAEPYCRVLQNAYRAGKPGLAPEEIQKLQLNLALAASYKTPPDLELTRMLTAELLKPDADLGQDAIPLLYVSVTSRLADLGPEDRQLGIQACTRLLRLLQGPDAPAPALSDKDGVAFYSGLVQKVMTMADMEANALKQSGLTGAALDPERFYAAAGDFIWYYRHADWPFPQYEELERLFGWAIFLHHARTQENPDNLQLADYYLKRGYASVEESKPKLDPALADAEKALQFRPDLPAAHGLRCRVHLVWARQQDNSRGYLAHLSDSIEAGERAVEAHAKGVGQGAESGEFLADCLVYLSSAYVERANFEQDPSFQRQAADLTKARRHALHAEKLKQRYPERAYLASGNAYEDLAWIVEDQPEENYKKAVDAFTQAYNANPLWPQALCSRGRCYYRYVAQSYLDPRSPQMGKKTRLEVLRQCEDDLQRALNLDLASSLAEGHYVLGLAREYRHQYEQADDSYRQAKSLTKNKQDSSRAVYVLSWARLPLTQAAALLSDENLEPEQRYQTALALYDTASQRAEELKNAPVTFGGGLQPAKEAACILAEIQAAKAGIHAGQAEIEAANKELAEALSLCNAALPQTLADADRSDVDLLLTRSRSRLSLLAQEWSWPGIDEAIEDAEKAADLAVSRLVKATAHVAASNALGMAFGKVDSPADPRITAEQAQQQRRLYLDRSLAHLREALRLAPRHPDSWAWAEIGGTISAHKIAIAQQEAEREKAANEAYDLYQDAINRITGELELVDAPDQRERLRKEKIRLEQIARSRAR